MATDGSFRRRYPGGVLLRVLPLALAVMLFAGACGPGDGNRQAERSPGGDAAVASNEIFCESMVSAETAVLAASAGGDPGDLEKLIATAEKNAPEEVAEQVGIVAAAVRQALESQDDSAFGTEEFAQNEEEVDQWVAANCGFDSVDVTAVEYAFEGVPATLPAGITTFNFRNEGEEIHEMLMVRFKDESMTIEDLMELSDKEAEKKIEFLGASFGPPGTEDAESKELTPGKYALVCFVPVGSTDEAAAEQATGPPHVARGMSAEFTVE